MKPWSAQYNFCWNCENEIDSVCHKNPPPWHPEIDSICHKNPPPWHSVEKDDWCSWWWNNDLERRRYDFYRYNNNPERIEKDRGHGPITLRVLENMWNNCTKNPEENQPDHILISQETYDKIVQAAIYQPSLWRRIVNFFKGV